MTKGYLTVTKVYKSGNVITVSGTPTKCKGKKVPELRRPETEGIREFIGDVVKVEKLTAPNSYRIAFNPRTLPKSTRPKVGETVWIYCANV